MGRAGGYGCQSSKLRICPKHGESRPLANTGCGDTCANTGRANTCANTGCANTYARTNTERTYTYTSTFITSFE